MTRFYLDNHELGAVDIEATHAHVKLLDPYDLADLRPGMGVRVWISTPRRWNRLRTWLYREFTGRDPVDWRLVFDGIITRYTSGGEVMIEDGNHWLRKVTINPDTGRTLLDEDGGY